MDNEARNYVHRLVNLHQVTVCEFIDFFAEKSEDQVKKKGKKEKKKLKQNQSMKAKAKAIEESTPESEQ